MSSWQDECERGGVLRDLSASVRATLPPLGALSRAVENPDRGLPGADFQCELPSLRLAVGADQQRVLLRLAAAAALLGPSVPAEQKCSWTLWSCPWLRSTSSGAAAATRADLLGGGCGSLIPCHCLLHAACCVRLVACHLLFVVSCLLPAA